MRVLKKPKLGNYPVAMIPGQFVDSYKVSWREKCQTLNAKLFSDLWKETVQRIVISIILGPVFICWYK